MKYLFSCLLLSMLCTISVAQPVKEAPIKNPMLWADVPIPMSFVWGYVLSGQHHHAPDARRTGNGIERSENWKTVSYIFDKLTDSPSMTFVLIATRPAEGRRCRYRLWTRTVGHITEISQR
mgnify:CR=1 FL=1